jgi:hypothetical protein
MPISFTWVKMVMASGIGYLPIALLECYVQPFAEHAGLLLKEGAESEDAVM